MDRTGARSRPRGRRALWVALAIVLALVVSAVVAFSVLLPAYPADRTAEAALADPPAGVTVVAEADALTLVPAGRPRRGLVFQPGARVDARAYGSILMPVAQAGHGRSRYWVHCA